MRLARAPFAVRPPTDKMAHETAASPRLHGPGGLDEMENDLLGSIITKTLLLLLLAVFVAKTSAADVFDRYIEVIGLREQHNGLLTAGFNTARVLSGGDKSESLDTETNHNRVKEIMIDELGFDALRAEYIAEVKKIFTKGELDAVIKDLEKPEVSAILRKQGEAFSAMLTKVQFLSGSARMNRVKQRIAREVLGR